MRFVIVGTSGVGKSTFANALANATGYPFIELDGLYWGKNWRAVPHEKFENSVLASTAGDSWVVDGNYSAVRDVLWARATHTFGSTSDDQQSSLGCSGAPSHVACCVQRFPTAIESLCAWRSSHGNPSCFGP